MDEFGSFSFPTLGSRMASWNATPLLNGYNAGAFASSGTSGLVSGLPKVDLTGNGGEGWFANKNNLNGLMAGISGLQTLGGLYTSLSQLNLAKKQQAYTQKITDTNLANQTKNYNTSLSDKAAARFAQEGKSADALKAYIAANSL